MGYIELLKAILHEERGHTRETAERLVRENPLIVTKGVMSGNFSLRGTAIALEMADANKPQES